MGCGVSFHDTTRYATRHVTRNGCLIDTAIPVQRQFCSNVVGADGGLLGHQHPALHCNGANLQSEDELRCDVFEVRKLSVEQQPGDGGHKKNNRHHHEKAKKKKNCGWARRTWGDLRAGDVIRIQCDEYVPCDVLLLSCCPRTEYMSDDDSSAMMTSTTTRKAFFDMSIVDGNTHVMRASLYSDFSLSNWCDAPVCVDTENSWAPRKDNFNAIVKANGIEEIATAVNFVPRYSRLINTCSVASVYCIALFTGADTFALKEFVNTKELNARHDRRAKADASHKPDLLMIEPEGTLMSTRKSVQRIWTPIGTFGSSSETHFQNEDMADAFRKGLDVRSAATTEKVEAVLHTLTLCFDSTMQLAPSAASSSSIERFIPVTANQVDRAMLEVAEDTLQCRILKVGPPERSADYALHNTLTTFSFTLVELLDFTARSDRQVVVGELDNGEVLVLVKGLLDAVLPLLKPKYESLAREAVKDVGVGQVLVCGFRRFVNREEYDRLRFMSRPDQNLRLSCVVALSRSPISENVSIVRDLFVEGIQEEHHQQSLQRCVVISRRPVPDLLRWCETFGFIQKAAKTTDDSKDADHNNNGLRYRVLGLTHTEATVIKGELITRVGEILELKDRPQLREEDAPYDEGKTIQFECCNKKDFTAYVQSTEFTKKDVVVINNINIHMNGNETEILEPLLNARVVLIAKCVPLQKAAYVRLFNEVFRTTVVGATIHDVGMVQEATKTGVIMSAEKYSLRSFDVDVVSNVSQVI
eukprot:PhM_4_TR3058/c0_g6_i1/m.97730